jgi:hypothetical protein
MILLVLFLRQRALRFFHALWCTLDLSIFGAFDEKGSPQRYHEKYHTIISF